MAGIVADVVMEERRGASHRTANVPKRESIDNILPMLSVPPFSTTAVLRVNYINIYYMRDIAAEETQAVFRGLMPSMEYRLEVKSVLHEAELREYQYIGIHIRSIGCHRAFNTAFPPNTDLTQFKRPEDLPDTLMGPRAVFRSCLGGVNYTKEVISTVLGVDSSLPVLICDDNMEGSLHRRQVLKEGLEPERRVVFCSDFSRKRGISPIFSDMMLLSKAKLFLGTFVSTFSKNVAHLRMTDYLRAHLPVLPFAEQSTPNGTSAESEESKELGRREGGGEDHSQAKKRAASNQRWRERAASLPHPSREELAALRSLSVLAWPREYDIMASSFFGNFDS